LRPRDERPTAVICWNDEFAYMLLDFCADNGIRVPGDLAVIGFDGAHTFPTPRQRLTTVFVPWSDLAETAVCSLVDMREGKAVPKQTFLPIHLQAGDTA
jgi:DNA-binding LacI/PurR family transcriptional regulator